MQSQVQCEVVPSSLSAQYEIRAWGVPSITQSGLIGWSSSSTSPWETASTLLMAALSVMQQNTIGAIGSERQNAGNVART